MAKLQEWLMLTSAKTRFEIRWWTHNSWHYPDNPYPSAYYPTWREL